MSYTQHQKTRSLAFTSLGHFVNDGNFLLISLLLVYYLAVPQVNLAFVALMAAGYNLISGLSSIAVGYVADVTGKDGHLISLGIFLQAVAIFLFAMPFRYPDYWFQSVLTGSILLGFGQAFYHPLGASILRSTYGAAKAPLVMGINGSMGSIGRAMIPFVLAVMILSFGKFYGFVFLSVYTVIGAILILLGLFDFRKEGVLPKQKHTKEKTPAGREYWIFMSFLSTVIFLRSVFMGGSVLYIGRYLFDIFGSEFLLALFLALTLIPPIIGQPLLGAITTLKGGRFATNLTGITSTIFFMLFLLTTNPIAMGLFFMVFSFMGFSLFPVMLGYIGQQVREGQGSVSNSIAWGLGNSLGFAVGALVMTFWTGMYGIPSGMWLMLAFGAVSTIIFISFRPDLNK